MNTDLPAKYPGFKSAHPLNPVATDLQESTTRRSMPGFYCVAMGPIENGGDKKKREHTHEIRCGDGIERSARLLS